MVSYVVSPQARLRMHLVKTWNAALFAAYGASALVAAPLIGWCSDRFAVGNVIFMASSSMVVTTMILFFAGKTVAAFMVARVCQGIYSSATWSAGLALLSDRVVRGNMGRALGVCTNGFNVALIVSPLVGGWLFRTSGFASIFACAIPLIMLDLALRIVVSSCPASEERIAENYWLIETTGEGAPCISPAISISPTVSIDVNGDFMTDTSPLVGEGSSTGGWPLLALLKKRRLQLVMGMNFINVFSLTSFDTVLPLYVNGTFGWDSTGAGLIFLPLLLPTLIAPYVGKLCDKHGTRGSLCLGFTLACPVLIMLRKVQYQSLQQAVLLCILLCLFGFSCALVATPVMAEIACIVGEEEGKPLSQHRKRTSHGQVYGLYFLGSALAALCGPLLSGLIQKTSGWASMTLFLGLLHALILVLLLWNELIHLRDVIASQLIAIIDW